jgi:Peptidase family S41
LAGGTAGGSFPETYLTDALDLIQANAFYADRVDWPSVRAEARRRAGAATTTAGTYDAVRWVLAKLGDHHSLLLSPEQARDLSAGGGRSFGLLALFPERVVIDVEPGGGADRAGARVGDVVEAVDGRPVRGDGIVTLPSASDGRPARVLLALRRARGGNSRQRQVTVEATELPAVRSPTARRLSARVSLLELFGVINALGPSASRYVEPAHDAIREAATVRTCGWVVDLRRNTGGSLPPMLAAAGPVLGDGKAVGYRTRDGTITWSGYRNGVVTVDGRPDRSLAAASRARGWRRAAPQRGCRGRPRGPQLPHPDQARPAGRDRLDPLWIPGRPGAPGGDRLAGHALFPRRVDDQLRGILANGTRHSSTDVANPRVRRSVSWPARTAGTPAGRCRAGRW